MLSVNRGTISFIAKLLDGDLGNLNRCGWYAPKEGGETKTIIPLWIAANARFLHTTKGKLVACRPIVGEKLTVDFSQLHALLPHGVGNRFVKKREPINQDLIQNTKPRMVWVDLVGDKVVCGGKEYESISQLVEELKRK